MSENGKKNIFVVESLLGTQKLLTCFHDAKAWCNNNAILETIW